MTATEWDDYADGWDSKKDSHVYSQRAFELWEQRVAPLYPDLSNCKVLDFGCGTGLLTEKLAARCGQVVAVDTSAKMIDVLRTKLARPGMENVVAANVAIDAESIKTNAELLNNFDLVVASSVCSFLPDFVATLRDLSLLMKPGAYLVQWDWMKDMPEDRIRDGYAEAGLINHSIDQVFTMTGNGRSMPVIMGIGHQEAIREH